MSLIDSMMETCILMNKTAVSDGEGGFDVTWTDGIEFECAIVLDASMRTRIAESEGFTNSYTITSKRNVSLDFHDVIKRKRDGKIFRVTSDGSDRKSPIVSGLDLKQCSAELWRLQNDESESD